MRAVSKCSGTTVLGCSSEGPFSKTIVARAVDRDCVCIYIYSTYKNIASIVQPPQNIDLLHICRIRGSGCVQNTPMGCGNDSPIYFAPIPSVPASTIHLFRD